MTSGLYCSASWGISSNFPSDCSCLTSSTCRTTSSEHSTCSGSIWLSVASAMLSCTRSQFALGCSGWSLRSTCSVFDNSWCSTDFKRSASSWSAFALSSSASLWSDASFSWAFAASCSFSSFSRGKEINIGRSEEWRGIRVKIRGRNFLELNLEENEYNYVREWEIGGFV